MSVVSSEFIKSCQVQLKKEPGSKVFATLAEALRKNGEISEALRIALRGVELHPHFVAGHIVTAQILIEMQQLDKALDHLEKAIKISSDNILAHNLLAECYLRLKSPKQALRSYKMVLLLNPNHRKAQIAVKKLESLTADEFDEELFKALDITKPRTKKTSYSSPSAELDRWLSLADAFIARNDYERAQSTLQRAEKKYGLIAEVAKRKNVLLSYQNEHPEVLKPLKHTRQVEQIDVKLGVLQGLLRSIGRQN